MNNPAVAQYASRLKSASAHALRYAGEHAFQLNVAGRIVRLQFAGDALVEAILPPFAHLLAGPSSLPDTTITLWDSESTGVALPDWPWDPPDGEAWKLSEGAHRAFFLPYRGSLTWYNQANNQAFYWNECAQTVFAEESFSPLLSFWAWFTAGQEFQLAHAAAVGSGSGAALLVGSSGSGKSTTSLLALNPPLPGESPLGFIADDYCLVSLGPNPVVFSLYSSAKLVSADKHRHTALAPAFVHQGSDKALYFLHQHFESRICTHLPLKALFAPVVTGGEESYFEPASPAQMLRRLAPSTLVQLHVGIDPVQAMQNLASAVRRLPCYHLYLGTDFERIPGLIARKLDTL